MTKHADEIGAKPHLGLEDATKVFGTTTETVCEETLVVCDATGQQIAKGAPEITPAEITVETLQSKAEAALHKLYDLERNDEPEKPLNVNLRLYQMENY